MSEVDVMFEIRNFYFIGAYHLCIKEAQKLSPKTEEAKSERDIFLYRSYIAVGKSNIVLSEVPESGAPPALAAIRRLALYSSESKNRSKIFNEVKDAHSDCLPSDEYELLINGLVLLNGQELAQAVCAFDRSGLLEGKACAVQALIKMNRIDLALKMLKKMQEVDEDATLSQLSLAWLYLHTGKEKLQDAFYIFQELMDKYGVTASLLVSQSATLLMQEKYTEAESLLAQADERGGSENSAALLINQYFVNSALNKPDEILQRIFKQLKLEHGDTEWVKAVTEAEQNLNEWVDTDVE